MAKSGIKLKSYLIRTFLIVAIVPLAITAMFTLPNLFKRLQNDIFIQNETIAKAITAQTQLFLQHPQMVMSVLIQDINNHSEFNTVVIGNILSDAVMATKLFEALYLLNEHKKIIAIGLPTGRQDFREDFLGLHLGHKVFIQKALNHQKAVWSKTFLSATSGTTAAALAIPMKNEFLLVGEIDLSKLSRFLADLKIKENKTTIILDHLGQIIAHPITKLSARQINLSNLNIIKSSIPGNVENREFFWQGETYYGTAIPIQELGWTALVYESKQSATKLLRNTGNFFIFSLVLALLGSIWLTFYLSRKVSQPLEIMVENAERIAHCEYRQNLPLNSFLELDKLSKSMSRMADAVADREEKLVRQAHYDTLTELPNRVSAINHIDFKIEQNNDSFALILININNFKIINDSMGHRMGDQIIVTIAKRLQANIKHPDMLANLGGDIFILILDKFYSKEPLRRLTERLLQTIGAKIHLFQRDIYIKANIGIAIFPANGNSAEELMSNADNAMYQAKQKHPHSYCFFSQQMHHQINENLLMEHQLHRALKRGEFSLNYQPLIDAKNGTCLGAEALLRWSHPQHGFVPPDVFIPIAESSGLIISIGDWVLEQACKTYKQWQRRGLATEYIAINISRVQFHSNLFAKVKHYLEQYDLPVGTIELEITESALMENDGEIKDSLENFSASGFHLALDDFGTGYSSLSYLRQFPFQTLKIDRSFVKEIPANKNDILLVKTIIAMAQSLNLKVTAEGVETTEQAEFLIRHGCDVLQGYIYSKPLPAENFLHFLKQSLST